MHANLLHVVAVVNNPMRYQSRIAHAKKFIQHMLDSGVNLTVVETAIGDRPFELDQIPHIRYIPTRCRTVAWSKESAINVGIRALPSDAKYVAWIDADIEFRDPNWASETVHALQLKPVVQPWSEALDLGPKGETMLVKNRHVATSFGSIWAAGGNVIDWWKNQEVYSYPHCLPGDSLVVPGGDVLAASSRPFKGDLVVIRTASGKELTCSPNHPILTDSGWVAAKDFQVGDHVFAHLGGNGVAGEINEKQVGARIEDVARAFSERAGVSRSTHRLPDDFDGNRADQKIANVWTERLLPGELYSGLGKKGGNLVLGDVGVESELLYGRRTFDLLGQGLDLSLAPDEAALAASLSPELDRGVFEHAGPYPVADRFARSGVSFLPEAKGPRAAAFAGKLNSSVLGSVFGRHALGDNLSGIVGVHADNVGAFRSALAGQVKRDEVVYVGRREFDGHLYDLSTVHGYIIADQIVTHNSGYAWAARMSFLNSVGLLLDFSGLGAADHQMSLGMIGEIDRAIESKCTDSYKNMIRAWGNRAFDISRGHVGFVPGRIEHFFHGSKQRRKYVERWQILIDHNFDPLTDLYRNRWGILELADNKPEFTRDVERYFSQRDEDANTL